MNKVTLICGRICCGKTTLAEMLCREKGAVLLSVDEIMLPLFGQHAGDRHDDYTAAIQRYLFDLSVRIVRSGTDVILDWGFWTRSSRDHARDFYRNRDIPFEFLYPVISDDEWQNRIAKRNAAVLAGETEAYYIDGKLAEKAGALFDPPAPCERDILLYE